METDIQICDRNRYPVGVQNFPEIIEGGFMYVDKTQYVYKLKKAGKYYFLSRPRRFGKSLFLSTIETYYRGRRDLFTGLALDSLTDEWTPHPVLHIDLNSGEFNTRDSLFSYLDHLLKQWEIQYGVELRAVSLGQRLGDVIRKIYETEGEKVVVLVDEYDKPMLNAIDDDELADYFRTILKAFYSNLKTMDAYIEFAMLTGVSRFSKVSIFSDLNNLRDISFDPEFTAICGISDSELDKYFHEGIECLARMKAKPYEKIKAELKYRYDGYHFSENTTDIYNPFSLVNVFAAKRYSNYWISSGTPTYIVKLLRKYNKPLREIEEVKIKATKLATEGILSKDLIPTLYQSGYLTIKSYNERFNQYILGYPNGEVEEGFIDFLMPIYLGSIVDDSEFSVDEFVGDVHSGNPERLMKRIDSMLRGVPHLGKEDPHEHTFQNAIYLIFKMIGVYAHVEDHTSDGRIDLTIKTKSFIYIFEFKVDRNADIAIEQIYKKEYWKKFESEGKKIFLIGANFNTDKKAIDDIVIEVISR